MAIRMGFIASIAWVAMVLAACGKESESAPPPKAPEVAKKAAPSAMAPAAAAAPGSFAEWMDQVWDQKPKEGKANLRLLVTSEGKPFSASPDGIQTDFQVKLSGGGAMHMTGMASNAKGRYVYEGLPPGSFTVEITHSKDEYQPWKKEDVALAAGESPVLEVALEKK